MPRREGQRTVLEVIKMNGNRWTAICGVAAALCLGAGSATAQDNGTNTSAQEYHNRGNYDPAQFQQRILGNIRERLAFTNDAEWAAVQPLVQKVIDDRRAVGFGMAFGRGRGGGGNGGNGSPNAEGGRRDRFGSPSPEAESLQSALDANAPAAQVKAALEKYRASKKEKEARLEQDQETLRKVLTVHQEAQAVLMGLVN
jgi:hypothetical protein